MYVVFYSLAPSPSEESSTCSICNDHLNKREAAAYLRHIMLHVAHNIPCLGPGFSDKAYARALCIKDPGLLFW